MADKTLTAIASFGDQAAASALIVAEIDGWMHRDAEGNEQSIFLPGDAVYFFLHADPVVRIVRVRATDDGDVQLIGPITRTRKQEIGFTDPEQTVELPHRPNGQPTVKWFGRVSPLRLSGRSLRVVSAPCLGEVSYNFSAVQYRHRLVSGVVLAPGEDFPVDIVVEYRVE